MFPKYVSKFLFINPYSGQQKFDQEHPNQKLEIQVEIETIENEPEVDHVTGRGTFIVLTDTESSVCHKGVTNVLSSKDLSSFYKFY